MEIYKNKSWEKLCTTRWDDAEVNLTCKAMGYFNNGPDDNGTWFMQKDSNASNATIRYDCTPLTHNCVSNGKGKLQLCEGI